MWYSSQQSFESFVDVEFEKFWEDLQELMPLMPPQFIFKSGHTVHHVVDKSYNYYNVIVFSSDSIFQKAHFYAHNLQQWKQKNEIKFDNQCIL